MIGLILESSCQIVKAVKDPSFSVRHSEVPSVDVVVSHSGGSPTTKWWQLWKTSL